ncbi:hypothetical protein Moror_11283 [Moniliophthora roreri MCA 2997]|uniref:Uncharacterized protein n=2 Tax=Moniliophthora roreri TaxID=221103 RepID=V2X4P8_MONRO|nr:hypothetical protein Moror_11283 [Moniliophthora roreri MCA 2997]KAI3619100.1 hypothetical protein WG66_012789 [Moniliophthora roreri]
MDTPIDPGPSTQLTSTSTTSRTRRHSSQPSQPAPSDRTLRSRTQFGNAASKSLDRATSTLTEDSDPSGSPSEPIGIDPTLNRIDEEEEDEEEGGARDVGPKDQPDTPERSRIEVDDQLQRLYDAGNPEAVQIAEEAESLRRRAAALTKRMLITDEAETQRRRVVALDKRARKGKGRADPLTQATEEASSIPGSEDTVPEVRDEVLPLPSHTLRGPTTDLPTLPTEGPRAHRTAESSGPLRNTERPKAVKRTATTLAHTLTDPLPKETAIRSSRSDGGFSSNVLQPALSSQNRQPFPSADGTRIPSQPKPGSKRRAAFSALLPLLGASEESGEEISDDSLLDLLEKPAKRQKVLYCPVNPFDGSKPTLVSEVSITVNHHVITRLRNGWIHPISMIYFAPTYRSAALASDSDTKGKLPNVDVEAIDMGLFTSIARNLPRAIYDYYIPPDEREQKSEIARAVAEMLQTLFTNIVAQSDFEELFLAYREYAHRCLISWHQNKRSNIRVDIWDDSTYVCYKICNTPEPLWRIDHMRSHIYAQHSRTPVTEIATSQVQTAD